MSIHNAEQEFALIVGMWLIVVFWAAWFFWIRIPPTRKQVITKKSFIKLSQYKLRTSLLRLCSAHIVEQRGTKMAILDNAECERCKK